jgi:hypothetical protein
MPCRRCASGNQTDFSSEICAHFQAPKDSTRLPIFVLPVLRVCLDCALTESVFPKEESNQLVCPDDSASAATTA